jgi:hypothetical protein
MTRKHYEQIANTLYDSGEIGNGGLNRWQRSKLAIAMAATFEQDNVAFHADYFIARCVFGPRVAPLLRTKAGRKRIREIGAAIREGIEKTEIIAEALIATAGARPSDRM